MRSVSASCLISIVVSSAAYGQTVEGFAQETVTLTAGGAADTVTLTGKALDQPMSVTVLKGSMTAASVQVALLPAVGTTERSVVLQAMAGAVPGGDYGIEISSRDTRRTRLRLRIVVVSDDNSIAVTGFSLSQDSVYSGTSVNGTVTVSAAPVAPLAVGVTSDDAAVAPAQGTIGSGQTQVEVPIATSGVSSGFAVLTAVRPPYMTGPQDSVRVFAWPAISKLEFDGGGYSGSGMTLPPPLIGGTTRQLIVRLGSAAPLLTQVQLSASGPLIGLPSSADVIAGTSAVEITATIQSPLQTSSVQITATIGPHQVSETFTVLPAGLLTQFANSGPGNPVGGTDITLNLALTSPAPSGGATILLVSSAAAIVPVPDTVTIPAGASSTSVVVHTLPVLADTQVELSASHGSVTKNANVTLRAPSPASLSVASSVMAGDTASAAVALNGLVVGGATYTVDLSSSDPAVASVPATVSVTGGTYQAGFSIATHPGFPETLQNVTITATAGGTSKTATLTVQRHGNLAALSLPASMDPGKEVTGTVALDKAAGPHGHLVTLAVSPPDAWPVPDRVTIAAGSTSASFTAKTASATSSMPMTVTASDSLGFQLTGSSSVEPQSLTGVEVTPSELDGGQVVTIRAEFARPIPNGVTETVDLISSSLAVPVPATLLATAGPNLNRQVDVKTEAVAKDELVTITAKFGDDTRTATFTLRGEATVAAVSLDSTTLTSGSATTLTVTLSRSVSAETGIALASSNTSLATVPASVTVASGQSSATATIATDPGWQSTVTVSATAGGVTKEAQLTVTSPDIVPADLSAGAATVGPNTAVPFTLTLKGGAAPTGGATIGLSASHPSLVSMPSNVVIPAGQTSVTFTVSTLAPSSSTPVTFTATLNAHTASATMTITP